MKCTDYDLDRIFHDAFIVLHIPHIPFVTIHAGLNRFLVPIKSSQPPPGDTVESLPPDNGQVSNDSSNKGTSEVVDVTDGTVVALW